MTPDQKIDKIYDMCFKMNTEIAKSLVHQENHAQKLIEHETKIGVLNDYKNTSIGKTLWYLQ